MRGAGWRALSPFIAHPRRSAAALGTLALLSTAAEACVLVLVMRLALAVTTDRGTIGSLPLVGGDLSVASATTLGIAIGTATIVIHIAQARLLAQLSSSALHGARSALITSYFGADWEQQAVVREGQLVDSITTLAPGVSMLAMSTLAIGIQSLQLGVLAVAAVIVDLEASAIVAAIGAVLFAVLRPLITATRAHARQMVAVNADLTALVTRSADMAMEVKVFGAERSVITALQADNARATRRTRSLRFAGRIGENLYRDLALVFLVVVVALANAIESLDIAAFGAVVLIMLRAANGAQQLHHHRQYAAEHRPMLDELTARIGTLRAAATAFGSIRLDRVGTVSLRDVGYRYESEGAPALEAVTAELHPGEIVGITGPSGGGKSTLVQVLARLRVPTSGQVLIDGHDYLDIHADDWTRLVSLVPQEPRLMSGTIRDNILFGRTGFDDAAVERVARLAHVWDEVERLPDGIDTPLGSQGIGLSGGQKQRIAVARALLGQPGLLVLDEPTSALDAASEDLLIDTVGRLRGTVTVVLVTHRPSALAACDRMLEIKQGRLVP